MKRGARVLLWIGAVLLALLLVVLVGVPWLGLLLSGAKDRSGAKERRGAQETNDERRATNGGISATIG